MKAAPTQQETSFFRELATHGATNVDRESSAAESEVVDGSSTASPLPQKKPRKPDRRRALTRRAIIDAASELFVARGVEATTIDDIAAAAELSAGTLYFHFGSKENVVLALVCAVLDAEAGHLAVAERTGPALDRLLRAGHRYLRFAAEEPVAFGYIVAGLPELPDDAPDDAVAARRAIASRVREFAVAIASDLQQAMDDGAIAAAPLDEALALVWSLWNGIADLIRRNDEFAISAEFGEQVLTRGCPTMLGALPHPRPST